MIKVGILGASAYTSLELLKILLRHSGVEVSYLAIRGGGNPAIFEIFPWLENRIDIRCSNLDKDSIPEDVELVFVTLPPTVAKNYVPNAVARGVKVVDLSADYRFRDKDIYEQWYKSVHEDTDGINMAVYGLPELFKDEIRNSALVANPGCYPTGAILGLTPLIKGGLISTDDIIIDAKSGISGAGKKPTDITHYCERNENIEAYNVGCHRHGPEINHILSRVSGLDISTFFTPHLIPMNRGILNTVYAKFNDGKSVHDIENTFDEFYRDEPFVRIKTQGLPRVVDVVNTNFCDISFTVVRDRVILITCIDNMVKGASGQAVQNMNIMLGFDETRGLL